MKKSINNKPNLKKKFNSDLEKIRRIVNDFDPCGFIKAGAPKDEYDGLSMQLLCSVYDKKNKVEIKELILNEIRKHFGTPDLEILSDLDTLVSDKRI